MVSARGVEKNTIVSFNVLKQDIKILAKWVVWNKKEHEALKQKLAEIEVRLKETNQTRLVASIKARKVHSTKCLHAKRIKESNRTYFDMLNEAQQQGYSVCDCTA
jgi:S-ribosylhomocysteine lyase LuxS involved in autoinducer biosynthesis